MRRLISILIAACAVLATVPLFFNKGIDETIKHSQEINSSFRTAVRFIDDWKRTHGSLPTSTEFYAWANGQPDTGFSPRYMQYSRDAFSEEVIGKFGKPTGAEYLLTFWRGEWNDYYPSWSSRGTLILDRSNYYLLGSKWMHYATFGGIFFVLLFIAYKVWPRGKPISLISSRSGI